MFFGRSKKNGEQAPHRGGAGVVERPAAPDIEQMLATIRELSEQNRRSRDLEVERQIRRLRNLAGVALVSGPLSDPCYAEPASQAPAMAERSHVPEVEVEALDAPLLRAAILEHGCLLVRGLADRERAERMAGEIDHAFTVREQLGRGEADPGGYYDELVPEPPYAVIGRPWVADGGGMLAADSPRLLFEMLELFERAGLRDVVGDYLGEPPAVSAEKCTLRRTTADLPKAWHQDGKFLGDVRALNVWLSLTRSGDVAPGLDVVPRRIEQLAESGAEGSIIDIEVSQALAEELAGDAGISRPLFDPGDALLFDDLFLHQTGSDPSMMKTRYAIESWFFGLSAYPHGYVPIAF